MTKTGGKTYKGSHDGNDALVMVHPAEGEPYSLPWRLDLWNHSPTGLNWGYGGSGPAQCALALLADHLGDDRDAVKLHQPFKWAVVSAWPMTTAWELTSAQIDEALAELTLEKQKKGGDGA